VGFSQKASADASALRTEWPEATRWARGWEARDAELTPRDGRGGANAYGWSEAT
jgi:hypothetical protein